MSNTAAQDSMYNEVFISYARKNKDFAQKIVQAIYDSGSKNIWVDWEDIEYAEDWWQKIQAGIESADNFIFIITPDSLQSKACYNEIEHAFQSGKRIIPILHIPLPKNTKQKVHPVISQHNWLPFEEEDDFDDGMRQLIKTVRTDFDHVRFHTRLQTRAREWEQFEHNAAYLLSTGELIEAQAWLTRAGLEDKRPLVTDLQFYYINTSQKVEDERQAESKQIARRIQNFKRASTGLGIVASITILATFASIIAFVQANNRVAVAEISEVTAHARIVQVETQISERIVTSEFEIAQARGQAAGPLAQAQAEIARAQTQVAEQIVYASTQIAYGDIQVATEIAQILDWSPVIQGFNCQEGYCVQMVLVPPGCFKMGDNTGSNDEKPVHSQCISQPFWIDRYEVSNEQFSALGGQAQLENYWPEALQPKAPITWFEALDFCRLRGGSLPTEAQWEYAARGRNNLNYPWGNEFVGENATFSENAGNAPTIIGSHPQGASWVGAMDMAGNVWEWTSTIQNPVAFFYPYRSDDGREDLEDTSASRVLRGGSFLDESNNLYSANRGESAPSINYSHNGFRCVLPIPVP